MFARRLPSFWIVGAVLLATFCGVIALAAVIAPRHRAASDRVIHEFFGAAQKHDYERAYAQLSPTQRTDLTLAQFQNQWREFESKHGPIQKWGGAEDGSSGKSGRLVNLWPPFVDATMAVEGERKGRLFALRLAPENGEWQISRFRIMNE